MTAKLTWIDSTEGRPRRFRTPAVEGELTVFPEVGGVCVVVGPPIDPGADMRIATTSKIVRIRDARVHPVTQVMTVVFETQNSVYQLDVQPEEAKT